MIELSCLKIPSRLIWGAFLGLALSACGFTAPRHSDGFAELESLGVLDVDRTFSLSLGPTVLRFAAAHIDDDPETARMLRGLEGVRIRIYEIDGDPARVAARMHRMGQHLKQDGWESLALIRDRDEETQLLVRIKDQQICGMTVLTSDGKSEAVVINLMGEIRPEQFGDVMVALEVDAPGLENAQLAEILN